MNIFRKLKETVTARQAAERYGLAVNRAGMCRCPFHHDRTPSMKVDSRYYCFGCGATGDAVDLTAQLLELEPAAAAKRLAKDFSVQKPRSRLGKMTHRIEKKGAGVPAETFHKIKPEPWTDHAVKVSLDYLGRLRDYEKRYAPQETDDKDWHPCFCEALSNRVIVEYILDELLAAGPADEEELQRCFGKEIERIEKRLERYDKGDIGRETERPGRSGNE